MADKRDREPIYFSATTWERFREWATCPKEVRERARSLRREWLDTAPHEDGDPATKELIEAYLPYLRIKLVVDTLGARIEAAFVDKMSKAEATDVMGFSRPTLYKRLEHPEDMTVFELLRLCYATGVRPDEVLGFMDGQGARLVKLYDSLSEAGKLLLMDIAKTISDYQDWDERQQRSMEYFYQKEEEEETEEEAQIRQATQEQFQARFGDMTNEDGSKSPYLEVLSAYRGILNRDPLADILEDGGAL